MAKAVLEIEMPEYCAQCPFMANESGATYCRMGDDGDCHSNVSGFGKPKWCPLIPLPERKHTKKWVIARWQRWVEKHYDDWRAKE